MNKANLADYLNRDSAAIDGWLSPTDAELLVVVSDVQHRLGVRGNVMEVGVFKGKSSILLGYGLDADSERLFVCDIFEGSEINDESVGWRSLPGVDKPTREAFLTNFTRFHREAPIVLEMPSQELEPSRIGEGAFRLIHIDGAHDYSSVKSDIALTRRLANEDAVVVFDDVAQTRYPGVAAAVWDAVLHNGLEPILITGKLYATWNPRSRVVAALKETVLDAPKLRPFEHLLPRSSILSVEQRREDAARTLNARIKESMRDVTPPALYRAAHRARSELRSRRLDAGARA